MTRSLWKGCFLESCFLKKSKTNFNVWSRSSSIPFSLTGKTVLVHNGKEFKKLLITREKIGFKFGEFVFTRSNMIKPKKSNFLAKKKNK
jgi:small subunit ribosomal protein S19